MKICAAQRLLARNNVREKRALLRQLKDKSRIDNLLDKLKVTLGRPTHIEDSTDYLAFRGDYFWDRDNTSTSLSYVLDEELPTKYSLHLSNRNLDLVLYLEGNAKQIVSGLEQKIRNRNTSKEQEAYLKKILSAFKQAR